MTFLGTRDALPELLAPADVFLLASEEESFGLSALEAMSCGTPVVAADVGGLDEVVENGTSGLLCPPGDREAYVSALRSLLFDRPRAQTLGAAARQRAESHFDRTRIVSLYEGLYSSLVGERA